MDCKTLADIFSGWDAFYFYKFDAYNQQRQNNSIIKVEINTL